MKVKKYHEDSLDQADIEDTEFFYRYQLEYKTKEISRFTHEDDPPEAKETPVCPLSMLQLFVTFISTSEHLEPIPASARPLTAPPPLRSSCISAPVPAVDDGITRNA